jgi:transcription termination factor Rho
LATALIDTGSRTYEGIFGELKGMDNMEINLDRRLVDNTTRAPGPERLPRARDLNPSQ